MVKSSHESALIQEVESQLHLFVGQATENLWSYAFICLFILTKGVDM